MEERPSPAHRAAPKHSGNLFPHPSDTPGQWAVTHVQVILTGVIQDLPKEAKSNSTVPRKPCKLSTVIFYLAAISVLHHLHHQHGLLISDLLPTRVGKKRGQRCSCTSRKQIFKTHRKHHLTHEPNKLQPAHP